MARHALENTLSVTRLPGGSRVLVSTGVERTTRMCGLGRLTLEGGVKFTVERVALRRTSENEPFPWLRKLVTLVRVARDGTVQQAKNDSEKRALVDAARDGDLVLAAWPGDWSQDVFVVDDLRAARIALGLPRNGTVEAPARGPDRESESGPRLWERLAGTANLAAEGQRQVGCRSPRAVEALLQRPDLDPEVRARVIDELPAWWAAGVVQAGNVTATEVARLLARFPDSAGLLVAALFHPGAAEIARRSLGELSYDRAAEIWVGQRPGPELAALLLPVVLTRRSQRAPVGFHAHRYDRPSLVRSMFERLPMHERPGWIRHSEHGPDVRRALLSGAVLTDEELLACLPEVTEEGPALFEYVRRYPRLVDLARPDLVGAVMRLVADGWSPVEAARSGQWADLVTAARIAETGDLIDRLAHAAVFDCEPPTPAGVKQGPWREPLRYELVDLLVVKAGATDKQIRHILERLGSSDLVELRQSPGRRGRLARLTSEVLESRRSPRSSPSHLPSDDELSEMDDPAGVLLRLWRNRGAHERREAVAAHILSSRHTTEELAWRLPILDVEQHPIWGPRLAETIIAICGDSPARWQEFGRAWGQPTQLLAATLLSRLEKIER